MAEVRTCARCPRSLPATARRDARYCSDRCRLAARRAKAAAPRPADPTTPAPVEATAPRPAAPALPCKPVGPWSIRNPLG